MIVRGFIIPPLLASMIADGRLRRVQGSWPLRAEFDHYGHFWQSELGHVHESAAEMDRATSQLTVGFEPEPERADDEFASGPGYIPYINDFSQVVEFAISGDGSPYCLDYRDQKDEPSVIWWDDAYWRRVAPTFTDFIALFDLSTP